ncbi:MAG: SH3 domain-containing protein [Litorilinea sp.]
MMSTYRNLLNRRLLMLHLLVAGALTLAACQPVVDTRVDAAGDAAPAAQEEATEAVAEESTAELTEEPVEEPAEEPVEEPAEEPAEATPEPIEEEATEEPAEEATADDMADESLETEESEILLAPATATINTRSLRVRAEPDEASEVVAGAREGEAYRVIAISTDGAWVQIEIDRAEDGVGWVVTNFISMEGDITETATAPIVEAAPVTTTTPFGEVAAPTATIDTRSLAVRAEPIEDSDVIAGLALGDVFVVLGISPDGVWLQLELPEVGDGSGWVQANFVRLAGDLTAIPTVGEPLVEEMPAEEETEEGSATAEEGAEEDADTETTAVTDAATATVNTRSLFVRAAPDAASDPVAGAREGESYVVLEISADGQWVRIETDRSETGEGWVAAEFVTLE